jgi:hypothetical protein
MTSDRDRIAELEREVAELRVKLAPPAPVKRINEEGGVRISYPKRTADGFVMPTAREMQTLFDITCKLAPKLDPEHNQQAPDAHFTAFGQAFIFLASGVHRTEKLNTNVTLGWWVDTAQDWFRAGARSASINGAAFVLAVLAHGDIGHSYDPNSSRGVDFGLSIGGGQTLSNAWRQTIELCRVRPATV